MASEANIGSMSLDVLIAEYPGDGAWHRFAGTVPKHDDDGLGVGDPTIERVLIGEMGSFAAAWLSHPIAALEGRTPLDVASNHPQGLMALRSVIMRMPR